MTRLLKYYLDCITEDGTALIGYAARLRIGDRDEPEFHLAAVMRQPDHVGRIER